MKNTRLLCSVVSAMPFAMGADAAAQVETPTIDVQATYQLDGVAISEKGAGEQIYGLDNLSLTATIDLDRLIGIGGMTGHIHVLNNLGGNPNNRAETLQGIDNIEVGSQRLRLLEAWIEQRIGDRTTVRAGLYDLNSEFYSNEAASLLIAPAFGVGSEIAATGPNGLSIFPSTALSVRVDRRIGNSGYGRIAVLNANAGTIGDAQGVNLTFDDGALLIGEAGLERGGKIAVGAWTYTRRQDDVRDVDGDGRPVPRKAHGAYLLGELPLIASDSGRAVAAFARIGVSDGKTTSFSGGWQAGLSMQRTFAGRADSTVSIGLNQAYLSRRYRANRSDAGIDTVGAETAFEITYSDRVHRHLLVQPDFQIVLHPAGERARKPLLVGGLRMTVEM
ncbi:carbohydrate porin [Sphingomonas aliaeris]|uniref:Carbohydrate porin n=1 Tax=Sphingomonas aliaeris TaxID=2759526 RepID=A0A974NW18_9SPHN|nr:carbohydrate porin [Sphingomonas aliaeris]QQV77858.1 carbohydrate porin [Sphingomonas aliaeris]